VEPTSSLLDVRDLVQEVRTGTIGLDTFQERLSEMGIDVDWADDLYRTLTGTEEPEGESTSTGSRGGNKDDESLDRLMSMVDTEDEKDAPPSSSGEGEEPNGDSSDVVSALTDAVQGRGAESNIDSSAAEQLIEDIDQVLRSQVHPIVHHPKLRKLEASWRGLRFLVARFRFRQNVELAVLPASRDDLQEAMYHQVLMPEHSREDDEVPTSLPS
jgi:hypothetical protein